MSIDRSNTVLQYDQSFSVQGYQFSGIDNVTINYTTPLESSNILGGDFGFNLMNPFQAELSFDRNLLYIDPILLSYTGASSVSGNFLYRGKNYLFTSGFLNRYQVQCTVGEIPRISCSFNIYGKLEPVDYQPTILSHPAIFIPSPKSISVTSDNTETNRVKSFTYGLNINRQPVYSLDNGKDIEDVVFLPPITVSASLDFDATDFTPQNYQEFILTENKKQFNIAVFDRETEIKKLDLIIPNIELVSQNLVATSENSLTITNNYLGYYK